MKYNVAILTSADLQKADTHSTHNRARESRIRYYRKLGRLLAIRRGQWAVIPEGANPATFRVNPFLVAATLLEDATLAYHTALEFHGKAYSTFQTFTVLSTKKIPPLHFQQQQYRAVTPPKALLRKRQETFEVQSSQQEGLHVRVTSIERTLVDVLHKPNISGGWEEIWRSLESLEFLNTEKVLHYADLLGNARTTAAVGFYLEQHRESLMVDERTFASLARQKPKRPQYLDPGARKGGKLVPRWNLLVPHAILERTWEEPG